MPEGVFVVKKSWLFIGLITGLIAVLLTACQGATPVRQYEKGEQLALYDFSEGGMFEEGAYGGATLRIMDGTYVIDVREGDTVLWWGQWGNPYDDVIVDADVEQLTERNENAYGVMCRVRGEVGLRGVVDPTLAAVMQDSTPEATSESGDEPDAATPEATAESTMQATEAATSEPQAPLLTATPRPVQAITAEGDGYVFLIQGSGAFAIMRASGRNLTPLVDWTPHDAINRGVARNHLRAVCADDYLALYINDQFVGDATDDTYSGGQVGLAASATNRLGTRIAFDNLTVSAPAAP